METPQQITRVSPGFTRLSRLLAVLLAVGLALGMFVPKSRPYLALIPGRTIPMVWNLITCAFLETNIIQAIISISAVLLMSRRIEPVYSTKKYAKFVLIVALASGISMFAVQYLLYYVQLQGKLLFAEYYGFHGVLAGLFVALRHVMPGMDVTVLGALRIPTRYLPSFYVIACGIWAYFKGPLFVLPPVIAGAYSAWFYLRFIQSSGTGLRGDPSDDFKFSTFFPAFLEPVLDFVFGLVARLFCLANVHAAPEATSSTSSAAATSAEASRRRQRGAKALEERLANKGSALAQLAAYQPSVLPDSPTKESSMEEGQAGAQK